MRRAFPGWAVSALLLSGLLAARDDAPKPPVARKVPRTDRIHGEERVDEYHWLREKGSPGVLAHLEAENAYADLVLKPTEALQEALYKEMVARIKETDLSVPYRERGWFYLSRTEKGKQYPTYCRRKGSLDAAEEVILDLNAMAVGQRFLSVGAREVSDDGNLLAFTTDTTGFRQYALHVKDLRTGEIGPERIPRVTSVAWAADNRTLFYVQEHEQTKRSWRLYRHRLGAEEDTLVQEEGDERFELRVDRTLSGAFLVSSSDSHTQSEVRLLPADEPEGEWRVVDPRAPEHEYDVDHRGGLLYIRTNSGGRNFRLVTAPVEKPGREGWKEIVPHRDDVMLEGIAAFSGHLVRRERADGLQRLVVMDLESGESHAVAFPEPAYVLFPEANRTFETRAFRFAYQSPITPPSVFDLDLETRERTLLKETEVLGGYDRTRYQVERIHAKAPDGTRVPISLVSRKGTRRDGTAPLLLAGYGSYGAPNPAAFSSQRFSLVDRGVTCAIAHIRGGGEMGKRWHDEGRMLRKRNTFADFIACAEHLIAEKRTSRDRLVIQGGSAGGLLMGAVLNQRPDLFRAAVVLVPFVDVINTMLDETLPLTVGEFEEWGNPKVKEHYEAIKAYCPYTNLRAQDYPAILVRTSLNDSQVMYWEPAKYVARLRALKTDRNPLLFKINMAGGHGGSSGRYDKLREAALDTAFVLTQVGIRE